jgi:hypothetical protein
MKVKSMLRTSLMIALLATAFPFAGSAHAQTVRLTPVRPARPAMPASQVEQESPTGAASRTSATDESAERIGPDEVLRLKAIYEGLTPQEQSEMRELYDAMDIDLLTLFSAGDEPGGPKKPILPMVSRKKFARTPQAVLAARTKLGLEDQDRPDDAASPAQLAEWLHLNTMAGEWDALAWFLSDRAGDEGEGIYSHVIQSTNQGDPMLLPEEVLALANAAPSEPTNWQVDVLGQLLRRSAKRSSTGPMLEQIRSGTRLFGGDDVANHPRTAALLARAGMPDEAYDYLPPLDRAREEADGRGILIHGLYHADREETLKAWELFGEVALLEEEEFKLRQEALREAVTRLPEVPEAQATAWLTDVFASERLAPAALEVIALDAMALRQSKLSEAEKARAILVMKSAVETLLASGRVDSSAIKVPMQMLTIGLVAEAEAATTARAARGGPPPGVATLMRAMPEETWLDAIEPSLSARAYRAFTGVATRADEIDVALDILESGIDKHPGEAENMAGEFLDLWVKRLRPDAGSNQDAAIRAAIFAYGGRVGVAAAPLTRGRQARNLDRLNRVLELLEQRGVDPRTIPGVVKAFQACHSQSEAYTEEDIVRILGPVESMPPETSAQLAAAMQGGLSGDWRSREVQQRFGMRRNGAEIAQVVEDGYELALRLIDRSMEEEPGSWRHAVRKAALAYERLEHRRAQTDEELADYDTLRRESFDAFQRAAESYAEAASRGEEKPSAFVFTAWFNTAIGATDLSEVTRDNILFEGSERDSQIEKIRETIFGMEPAQAEEHLGLLATNLVSAVDSLNPEVKPRVVRHALRIVGDHPSAAPLRRINALYEDLIDDEIHLRLALDGPDRIGTEDPFAVVLSLRYTNAVDRETDGFAKYLQNGVWVNMGNRGTSVNYRDRLERSIRDSFSNGFQLEGIGFFDSMHPSSEVLEDGESGWQEKPLAYILLSATDPSIERVPPVQMDLDFMDQTGPVVLAIESNSPPVDAAMTSNGRPVMDLRVEQILDARNNDEEVILEIRAQGRGVVGSLDEILVGVAEALPGYALADDGITTHPINMAGAAADDDGMFSFRLRGDQEDVEYPEADPDGVHRQSIERSWTVRYVPTAAAASGDFTLPALASQIDGTIETRYFDDMDLVLAEGPVVPIDGGVRGWTWILVGIILLVGIVGLIALFRSIETDHEADDDLERLLPRRSTPLGAVVALERIDREYGERLGGDRRRQLKAAIDSIEERYFGREAVAPDGGLQKLVREWAEEAHSAQ